MTAGPWKIVLGDDGKEYIEVAAGVSFVPPPGASLNKNDPIAFEQRANPVQDGSEFVAVMRADGAIGIGPRNQLSETAAPIGYLASSDMDTLMSSRGVVAQFSRTGRVFGGAPGTPGGGGAGVWNMDTTQVLRGGFTASLSAFDEAKPKPKPLPPGRFQNLDFEVGE